MIELKEYDDSAPSGTNLTINQLKIFTQEATISDNKSLTWNLSKFITKESVLSEIMLVTYSLLKYFVMGRDLVNNRD